MAGQKATMATIPGGDGLIAQSWAQTVVGGWNVGKGSVPFRYQGTHDKNQPIFIVGNGLGPDQSRSNAFEVSYNGHSIVFDENGTGGAAGGGGRGAVQGGTYRDNVIYGWAEVAANGTLICDDFGVATISHVANSGAYRITLNPVGPDGSTARTINCGAVVATIGTGTGPQGGTPTNPTECFFIQTTNIVNNQFDVFITDLQSGTCHATDRAFKFHVTARPEE